MLIIIIISVIVIIVIIIQYIGIIWGIIEYFIFKIILKWHFNVIY